MEELSGLVLNPCCATLTHIELNLGKNRPSVYMATYSFLAKYLGIIWRAAVLTRDILIAPASNNVHRLKLYARLSSNFYQINPNFIHYAIQYVIVFGNVNFLNHKWTVDTKSK